MRFTSQPTKEHKDIPLADEGRLEHILELFSHKSMQDRDDVDNKINAANKSYVVSLSEKGCMENKQAKLEEILGLVHAQGDHIAGSDLLSYGEITPRTYIGSGTLRSIAKNAQEVGASLLVFDVQLSPSQMRNIEHLTGFAVSDREAVILNIFVKHANSRKSQVQVELAQLKYLRPRIRGIGLTMDQQSGGIMGGRGAGETASELLARQLDKRVAQLQKLSKKLSGISVNQRKQRSHCKRIALVGYTNAGKTSLMNQLVDTDLSVKDQVFETLDATTRKMSTSACGEVLLSDTVGFIRDLPKHLLESFESTLAEIAETDLLVIVLDISHVEVAMQLQATLDVLVKLGADDIPKLLVFNKIDLLNADVEDDIYSQLSGQYDYVALTSKDSATVDALKQILLARVSDDLVIQSVHFSYQSQDAIRRAYNCCDVLETSSDVDGVVLRLKGQKHVLDSLINQATECQQ
jgi:GTP-binding protein HflX